MLNICTLVVRIAKRSGCVPFVISKYTHAEEQTHTQEVYISPLLTKVMTTGNPQSICRVPDQANASKDGGLLI
jgi:hypothetical protein